MFNEQHYFQSYYTVNIQQYLTKLFTGESQKISDTKMNKSCTAYYIDI